MEAHGGAGIMENEEIARQLEFVAGVLESRDANPYRVMAYRNAARTIRDSDRSLSEILETEGEKGLRELPGIGRSIARYVAEYVFTGRMSALDRVRGRVDPVSLISSLPGIGPDTAEKICETLGVQTLEELEAAAHDGDLATVPGFGRKRIRGVIDALAGRLGSRTRQSARAGNEPDVSELLDVDREYREAAEAGRLRKIAPKRFNPSGEAWLPVLHTRRGDRFYTALYSNTARAHELGRTGDWVVLYYDGPEGSGQHTIITSKRGEMNGKRIVRGRERESQEYYERLQAA